MLLTQYLPHIHCYLGDTKLLLSMILTDALIGLSYFSLSFSLYLLVRRIRMPFSGIFLAFGVFIATCGATHFLEIYTLWVPAYWISAALKGVTALASLATAVWMIPLSSKVVRMVAENRAADENLKMLANSLPQLAWMANAEGRAIWHNKRWFDYTGLSAEAMRGSRGHEAYDPEELPGIQEAWIKAISSKQPFEMEFHLRGTDGKFRWFLSRANPVKDARGDVLHWFGTDTDIDDQRSLKEEILRAKDAAENANQLKSAFLANMSHEIRTPLGAIVGCIELMSRVEGHVEKTREYLPMMRRNSEQLLRVVDDILDLSKVEAGKLGIEHIHFSLAELLADLTEFMTFRAQERAIDFKLTAATPLPSEIISDPTRLRQILTNLIGNAIKFTDRGGVELCASATSEGFLEFRVTDTGLGISKDQAAKLFQPFMQADASTTRRYGGTGLGLALASGLARAMGGDCILEKSEIGKGSVFIARIRAELPATAHRLSPEELAGTKLKNWSQPAVKAGLNGMNILLVDDSADNQELIRTFLENLGATVCTSSNGRQGVDKALQFDFDAVLMDIQMPVMDGHSATRLLRSLNYSRPIIALTAHAMKEERLRAASIGFTDFISKPVKIDGLREVLAKYRPEAQNSVKTIQAVSRTQPLSENRR